MNRIFVAVLLAFLASAANAQTPDAAARIAAAREQAAAAGIPAVLLDNKIAEGQAKGVAPERIAGAIERRLASLIRARGVMGAWPGVRLSPADLKVGADALEAGVDEAVLGALVRSTPADRRTVAVAVLAQLVQGGEPSTRALQRVQVALRGDPQALQNLPARLAAENGRGQLHAGSNPGQPNLVGPPARGGPPASVPAAGLGAGANRPAGRAKP